MQKLAGDKADKMKLIKVGSALPAVADDAICMPCTRR